MARATWLLGATSLAGIALSLWLYLDNRALRAERASPRPAPAAADRASPAELAATPARLAASIRRVARGRAPALPDAADAGKETRMDRRARRTDEFAATFGRLDGESDDDYKARVMPLIATGLVVPRIRVEDQRKAAEAKAHVTAEQSARLDQAFDKVYADVLDFTNKAVADGELSPYERNVSGWLDYAGGLGGILNDANGQIGKILEPSQIRAMYDTGFEWGEYLGVKAPWEQLAPPPPRK
jgi:hypothetical protein